MISQCWLTDFDSSDNFWIKPSKLWTWISVSVPRVTSVQWMLKLYSVVMAGLGIILSLSWTCFHVYVLSVTQLPELRQQRSAISFGQTYENVCIVCSQKRKIMESDNDCDPSVIVIMMERTQSDTQSKVSCCAALPSWAYIDHQWWRLSWTFLFLSIQFDSWKTICKNSNFLITFQFSYLGKKCWVCNLFEIRLAVASYIDKVVKL